MIRKLIRLDPPPPAYKLNAFCYGSVKLTRPVSEVCTNWMVQVQCTFGRWPSGNVHGCVQ